MLSDAFFILPALSPGRLSRADDPNVASALAVRYEDDLLSVSATDRDLTVLNAGVIRVRIGYGERVEEDGFRLLKGYTVLVEAFALAAFHS